MAFRPRNRRRKSAAKKMKAEIHPEYREIKATCSCGNVLMTRSTLQEDIHLDVCSACHPFYTGKQKSLDAGGRVERFRKRFGNRTSGA
jgi:large subunit ribosomal protein L31